MGNILQIRKEKCLVAYLVFLTTKLFAITQGLFTEFNDFLVLFQLIHCHEVEVLYNLKIKAAMFTPSNATSLFRNQRNL